MDERSAENRDRIITWQMLGGLRYALLALKSQLLLVEEGAVVLLLLLLLLGGGGRAGWLRKAILTIEAVLP